jgi:DNA-directed RNA polymerase specialized sigma24 family protein
MKPLTSQPPESLENESIVGLLTTIGCAEIDRRQAEAALGELHRRYAVFLMGIAIEGGWERRGVDCDELVLKTLVMVWENPGAFEPKTNDSETDQESDFKLWLSKSLKNEFRDALRALARRNHLAPSDPESLEDQGAKEDILLWQRNLRFEEEPSEEVLALRGELVEQWMDTLNAADREIMAVSMMYIAPDTGKCFIPADELAGLAEMLGLLPETIKVKRGRLFARLMKFLTDNS